MDHRDISASLARSTRVSRPALTALRASIHCDASWEERRAKGLRLPIAATVIAEIAQPAAPAGAEVELAAVQGVEVLANHRG